MAGAVERDDDGALDDVSDHLRRVLELDKGNGGVDTIVDLRDIAEEMRQSCMRIGGLESHERRAAAIICSILGSMGFGREFSKMLPMEVILVAQPVAEQ